ncbi:hypothetical protein B0I72DRAFT_163774 [Yarrowia lipolytica]|jgi:hypothetical protein|uniref:Uncharacterized protein n=1 Tax=Yarrowia lipolytica TaxID=4952 RepID=A0A371BWX7_YARLL|nr:Hypothetical protein YALI2_C00201g [Yarrowia lipolytica]RDW22586.1 hypothetical protein B0I71DRAFT_169791 [Yarrowia lipolytica]RDW29336.1 hypothetical protein B0I72DRAFT_163774 [Yarrowia lipolytica]RDW36522.1 hypothetical protein B0I73DRAFT_125409 [Yarrowia lipolytica]RDW43280.1 hypothetical protein B0I74DRAFT_170366 [Yarrowia lipolytica]
MLLPQEIFEQIASHLTWADLSRLSQTCWALHEQAAPLLWNTIGPGHFAQTPSTVWDYHDLVGQHPAARPTYTVSKTGLKLQLHGNYVRNIQITSFEKPILFLLDRQAIPGVNQIGVRFYGKKPYSDFNERFEVGMKIKGWRNDVHVDFMPRLSRYLLENPSVSLQLRTNDPTILYEILNHNVCSQVTLFDCQLVRGTVLFKNLIRPSVLKPIFICQFLQRATNLQTLRLAYDPYGVLLDEPPHPPFPLGPSEQDLALVFSGLTSLQTLICPPSMFSTLRDGASYPPNMRRLIVEAAENFNAAAYLPIVKSMPSLRRVDMVWGKNSVQGMATFAQLWEASGAGRMIELWQYCEA